MDHFSSDFYIKSIKENVLDTFLKDINNSTKSREEKQIIYRNTKSFYLDLIKTLKKEAKQYKYTNLKYRKILQETIQELKYQLKVVESHRVK